MGFYIRKSLRVGPVRFNLSKSGIGVSGGVTGFRIGSGPRGMYVHAGRGGLYYRKYLFNGSQSRPSEVPVRSNGFPPLPPAPAEAELDSIHSAPASELSDSDAESLLDEIQRKSKTPPWFGIGVVLWCILIWSVFPHSAAAGVAMLVIGLAAAYPLYALDQRARSVVVMYDLEPAVEQAFRALYDGVMAIGSCAAVWTVTSKQTTTDYKHNAGATDLVDRKPLAVGADGAPFLKTNVAVPSLRLAGDAFYFLPDRVFVTNAGGIGALSYERFRATASERRFMEDGTVPRDAKIVGSTWRYVNRSGAPDRRFSNNRQIPVVLYQDVLFSSETGVRGYIELSRTGAADAFLAALQRMRAAHGGEGAARPAAEGRAAQPAAPRSSDGSASAPPTLKIDLTTRGRKDAVEAYWRDLSERLQKEVDARSSRAAQAAPAKPVEAAAYMKLVSQATDGFRAAFAELGPALEHAASPAGSTELFVLRYATLLEEIVDADRMLSEASPPPAVSRTHAAVEALVHSLYAQISGWPAELARAAAAVSSDSAHVVLQVTVDTASVVKAVDQDREAMS